MSFDYELSLSPAIDYLTDRGLDVMYFSGDDYMFIEHNNLTIRIFLSDGDGWGVGYQRGNRKPVVTYRKTLEEAEKRVRQIMRKGLA